MRRRSPLVQRAFLVVAVLDLAGSAASLALDVAVGVPAVAGAVLAAVAALLVFARPVVAAALIGLGALVTTAGCLADGSPLALVTLVIGGTLSVLYFLLIAAGQRTSPVV
jgi:hypothetical protein